MGYIENLSEAMSLIAEYPKAIFMGQSVGCEGTAMFRTLKHIDPAKRLELPVFEDCQLGMAIGMSLAGFLPVCIFPRWNFLLLATSALVLHLDKLYLYSNGGYRPKVIIRTAIATNEPLNPGPQHLGDFTAAYRSMLQTVAVESLFYPQHIVPAYKRALERDHSSLLVEYSAQYG